MVFILFIVCAFRGLVVGTDTVSYQDIFHNRFNEGFIIDFKSPEFLFSALYRLLNRIGASYRIVMIIQSLLFMGPIAWVMLKMKERPIEMLLMLFLLGFYFGSFNISRQSIAISFAFFGYYYYEREKYILFAAAIFFAIGFHLSAFLLLPVFLFRFVDFQNKWTIFLILLTYFLPLVIDLSSLSQLLIFNISELDAYSRYIEREGVMAGGAIPITGTIMTLYYIYIISVCEEEFKKNNIYYKISVFSVMLTNLLFVSPTWAVRIIMYFSIAQVPFLVMFGKKSLIRSLTVYGYAIAYYIYYYIIQNYNGVNPYVFDLSFNI